MNYQNIATIVQNIANAILFLYVLFTISVIILAYRFESGVITRDDNNDKITILNGRVEIIDPVDTKDTATFTFKDK